MNKIINDMPTSEELEDILKELKLVNERKESFHKLHKGLLGMIGEAK